MGGRRGEEKRREERRGEEEEEEERERERQRERGEGEGGGGETEGGGREGGREREREKGGGKEGELFTGSLPSNQHENANVYVRGRSALDSLSAVTLVKQCRSNMLPHSVAAC